MTDFAIPVKDSTEINPVALQTEFVQLSGHLAYWTQQYAEAQTQAATAKAALEQLEAKISLDHRTDREIKGMKATEALLSELVHTDDRWIKAKRAHILADGNRLKVSGIVDAIHAKKDMLVTLGAHMRAEMAAFPSVGVAAAARAHNASNGVEDWARNIK